MKKIAFIILILFATLNPVVAQDYVKFEFSDGISDVAIKSTMENNLSSLLTAINRAETNNKDINFSNIAIDDMASHSICMLWNNVRFRCVDEEIIEHCLRKQSGSTLTYQARNIYIEMKPIDDSYKGDLMQEICVDFDHQGKIIDFNITMGITQYRQLIKEGVELDDLDRRLQIIQFCEQFRNAYNQKNIRFMEDIFSDDALIITGKVIKRTNSIIKAPTDIEYSSLRPQSNSIRNEDVIYKALSKEEYLSNLRRVFALQSYINVQFDEYSIKRHGAKPNYYGVTLVQKWNSATYNDEGVVFLVWDFTDEDKPKIHVRTWQPYEIDIRDRFTLKDFKLP